jgi:hypothetical protein
MEHSRVVLEDKVYVKYDGEGNTEYVKGAELPGGFSYRRVHNPIRNE